MHPVLDKYFALIRRFLPTHSEDTSVGLDLGISECKLVEIKKSSNSFELLSWAIETIVGNDVKSTVQRVLSQLANPHRSITTAVSGRGTLIRYVDMPRMTLNDVRQSLMIESDKYFPFAQDQIYTDCYLLDPQGKSPRMPILAAAAKKSIIDQRVKLLSDLQLQPNFIGIDSVAIANTVNVLGLSGDEDKIAAMAILDIGETTSSLIIFVNRLPFFTRDINIGGQDFTKRISNALTIPLKDAEDLKIHPKGKLSEVMNASEASLMNLVQEIRMSFDYFSAEKNKEVAKLYLTGGGSLLSGLKDVLKKNMEIEVEMWNPFAQIKLGSGISAEEINRQSHKLGVSLGLALYNI